MKDCHTSSIDLEHVKDPLFVAVDARRRRVVLLPSEHVDTLDSLADDHF